MKNYGISDISVRQDKKIFATGGWDGRCVQFYIGDETKSICLKFILSCCLHEYLTKELLAAQKFLCPAFAILGHHFGKIYVYTP